MRKNLIVLSTLAALSACSSNPTSTADTQAESTNTVAAPADLAYRCDNGKTVTARYDNSDEAKPKAIVTIDGKAYTLDQAISASGARYTSETGPKADHLFTWWTKGTQASWYESPLDHTAKPEDEKLIATCNLG